MSVPRYRATLFTNNITYKTYEKLEHQQMIDNETLSLIEDLSGVLGWILFLLKLQASFQSLLLSLFLSFVFFGFRVRF